jgi:hypothetical protein
MATIQLYNHTVNRFNEGLNDEGDIYKVMLLNNDAVFDATDTTLVEVAGSGSPAANEVSGNGWDVGGEALASVVLEIYDTNGGKFDAADLSITVSGGNLGPIYNFVLYNDTDTDDPPVLFGALTSASTVLAGNNVGVLWPANGILLWTVG